MENINLATTTPVAMDLDDYLGQQGISFSTSGYCLDKLRGNRQLRTSRGEKRFRKECEEAEIAYQEKRSKAIEEYNSLVKCGKIRPLTLIERTIQKANGNPDNPSVQAAWRMCKKRGYDWKTGRKI